MGQLEEDKDNPLLGPSHGTVSSMLRSSQRLGPKILVEHIRELDNNFLQGGGAGVSGKKDAKH